MTKTYHLEPSQVPSHLRGSYTGKKFKAEICETMTIHADAGTWSGGSRDIYSAVELETGRKVSVTDTYNAPWDQSRSDKCVTLKPGFAIVRHSIFCGKDMGLTFYVHPDSAAKLITVQAVELTENEKTVLDATASLKSSYNGMDRYEMKRRDASYSHCFEKDKPAFMSRDQWEAAKQSLIAKGLLNKSGAITVAGRNAAS